MPGLYVVLSGCSGGGKSTLLEELKRRGYGAMPEPGRLVVQEELACGGDGLPWANATRFIEHCAVKSMAFYDEALAIEGPVFFDRSPIDHDAGMTRHGLPFPQALTDALAYCRYHSTVFFTPPWEEIFTNDAERRHSFASAVAEYEGLLRTYPERGFRVVELPCHTVSERADFIEKELGLR
jgi:predicted ATPase